MKAGINTTEFWVGALGLIGVVVGNLVGKEFPSVAFAPLAAFVLGRLWEKAKTVGEPAKRAWKTTEFWAAIGTCVLTLLVDMVSGNIAPEVQAGVLAVSGFVGLRGVAKTNPV